MKTRTLKLKKSAALVALSGLLLAGTAQAGMGSCMQGMSTQPRTPACASAQPLPPPCPAQSPSPARGGACPTGNEELMSAVGSMAAGGIGIATQVMRALLEEANRFAGPGQGL